MVSTLKHCGSGQAEPSPARSAIVTSALFLSLMAASSVAAQDPSPDGPTSGCLKCHAGIEPIRYHVRDFIDCSEVPLPLGFRYVWIFNVADVLLVVGVGILLVHWLTSPGAGVQKGKRAR